MPIDSNHEETSALSSYGLLVVSWVGLSRSLLRTQACPSPLSSGWKEDLAHGCQTKRVRNYNGQLKLLE